MNIRVIGLKAIKHVLVISSAVTLVSTLTGCEHSLNSFKAMSKKNGKAVSQSVHKGKDVYTTGSVYKAAGIDKKAYKSAPQKLGDHSSDEFDVTEYMKQVKSGHNQLSLKQGTRFALLAKQLEAVAQSQSDSYHNILSLQAERKALQFNLLPQIRPMASMPLVGSDDKDLTYGVSVEQTIMDFGVSRSRLKGAQKDIEVAEIEYWAERNSRIHQGLGAYLDASRYQLRLREYKHLEKNLHKLDRLLEQRADGGIADRGERLRLNVVQQEIRREILNDKMALADAKARLKRGLQEYTGVPLLKDLRTAQNMCVDRPHNSVEKPQIILAKLGISQAQIQEKTIRGQIMPKLLVVGSMTGIGTDDQDSTLGLRLDASNMLGFGSLGSMNAAQARSEGARNKLYSVKDDIRASLIQLDTQHDSYRKNQTQLQRLINQNREVLNVYHDQVEAGVVRLIDGISFYREDVNARISLLDTQGSIIQNCLDRALINGTLAQLTLKEKTQYKRKYKKENKDKTVSPFK